MKSLERVSIDPGRLICTKSVGPIANRDVLTVGMTARICRVSPRTVSKWVDTGLLYGYRLPGSRDRRIPAEDLRRFMTKHGMPLRELEGQVAPAKPVESTCSKCEGKRESYIPGRGFAACDRCRGKGKTCV